MINGNLLIKITVKLGIEPSSPIFSEDILKELLSKSMEEKHRDKTKIIRNIKQAYKGLLSKDQIGTICTAILLGTYVSIHIGPNK